MIFERATETVVAGDDVDNDDDNDDYEVESAVRVCRVEKASRWDAFGFHLSKGKWEPYPRVSQVDAGTVADVAGVREGDCLVALNGKPVLGEKIAQVATRIKNSGTKVELLLWTPGELRRCKKEGENCTPMRTLSSSKLSSCIRSIFSLLDCPVCLETISPPATQCMNGHLLCRRCRLRTSKCPTCRVNFSRARPIIADQLYTSLLDAFLSAEEPPSLPTAKTPSLHKRAFAALFGTKITKQERQHPLLTPTSSTASSVSEEETGDHLLASRQSSTNSTWDLFTDVVSSKASKRLLQHCPVDFSCRNACYEDQLLHHIHQVHGEPLLEIHRPLIQLNVGSSNGLPQVPLICMKAFERTFIVKTYVSDARLSVWMWICGLQDTHKFTGKISLQSANADDVSLPLNVFPISTSGTQIMTSDECCRLPPVDSAENGLLSIQIQVLQCENREEVTQF